MTTATPASDSTRITVKQGDLRILSVRGHIGENSFSLVIEANGPISVKPSSLNTLKITPYQSIKDDDASPLRDSPSPTLLNLDETWKIVEISGDRDQRLSFGLPIAHPNSHFVGISGVRNPATAPILPFVEE